MIEVHVEFNVNHPKVSSLFSITQSSGYFIIVLQFCVTGLNDIELVEIVAGK